MTEMTRESLRAEIEQVYQTSWMRRYWGTLGRGLARLVGRKEEAPLWLSALVAFTLTQLIAFGLVFVFKDQSTSLVLSTRFSYSMLALCWLGLVIFQPQIERFVDYFKTDIAAAIELPGGQAALESWLRSVRARSLQAPFLLLFILWIIAMLGLVVYYLHSQAAGVSAYLFLALVFMQTLPHLYWILVIALTFAFSIRQWKFKLFPDDPASTPIIRGLHRLSSNFLLAFAFMLALEQLLALPLGLYSQLYVVGMLAVMWTPTLLFYIFRESAFANLLINARFQRLAEIQKQIMEIEHSQDLSQKEPAEAVKRLLELHDHVKSGPVSMINMNSIANLLGSLALPLLTALISLFDLWKKLFGAP